MRRQPSRRKAREAVLRVLYEVEVGNTALANVLEESIAYAELKEPLAQYARDLALGVVKKKPELDRRIAPLLEGYDLSRVVAVDRNVLRIAAYELLYIPEMPPAVTIDEAIEVARKYSTAESGKFVNGVLGRLLKDTDKANWDPSKFAAPVAPTPGEPVPGEPAPGEPTPGTSEPWAEEPADPEPEPEVEEEDLDPNSDRAKKLARIGGWTLRTPDQ